MGCGEGIVGGRASRGGLEIIGLCRADVAK